MEMQVNFSDFGSKAASARLSEVLQFYHLTATTLSHKNNITFHVQDE